MSNIYSRLLDETDKGNRVVLVSFFPKSDAGSVNATQKILLTEKDIEFLEVEDLPAITDISVRDKSLVIDKIRTALDSGTIISIPINESGRILIEPYCGLNRLIILGGGHIAKWLVDFAAKLGFVITVVDDRPGFANTERFPEAAYVICDSFETCWSKVKPDQRSFVVIATRGHRHDLVCMREILKFDVAYLGMVSSRSRADGLMKQLAGEGYERKKLEQVFAPVGLPIGAQTPEEIALSILAQMIAVKRTHNVPLAANGNTPYWIDADRKIITELSMGIAEPKAMVTIISSCGSVPRKAGSKMLVWRDGRSIGSIGGGCMEAKVVSTAREVLEENRGIRLYRLDTTDELTTSIGSACGGLIEVVIEVIKREY